MHEHVAPAIYYFEVHLLYASLVGLAAWTLTSLWRGAATAKYWIWVATSLNFLVPFAGFFNGFGASRISWATQLGGLDAVGIGISRNLPLGANGGSRASPDGLHPSPDRLASRRLAVFERSRRVRVERGP